MKEPRIRWDYVRILNRLIGLGEVLDGDSKGDYLMSFVRPRDEADKECAHVRFVGKRMTYTCFHLSPEAISALWLLLNRDMVRTEVEKKRFAGFILDTRKRGPK